MKSQSAKIYLNFNFLGFFFWGGGILQLKNHKVPRSALISIFWGFFLGVGCGGGILQLKSQSANICLNFNFRGGGGRVSATEKFKYQDLPKFQFFAFFFGGVGVWQYSAIEKTQSAKICLNFNFRGGGGVFCH